MLCKTSTPACFLVFLYGMVQNRFSKKKQSDPPQVEFIWWSWPRSCWMWRSIHLNWSIHFGVGLTALLNNEIYLQTCTTHDWTHTTKTQGAQSCYSGSASRTDHQLDHFCRVPCVSMIASGTSYRFRKYHWLTQAGKAKLMFRSCEAAALDRWQSRRCRAYMSVVQVVTDAFDVKCCLQGKWICRSKRVSKCVAGPDETLENHKSCRGTPQ